MSPTKKGAGKRKDYLRSQNYELHYWRKEKGLHWIIEEIT